MERQPEASAEMCGLVGAQGDARFRQWRTRTVLVGMLKGPRSRNSGTAPKPPQGLGLRARVLRFMA